MQVLRIFVVSLLVALCWADSQDKAADAKPSAQPQTDNQTNRTRRSDVLGLFNTKFHKKFALLGSLSSSNPHIPETGPDYGPPITYDHKAFSLWSFKKAIFSTLLQAIKAITGGVIALKGQIIKVKGHLIAAKGHLLQTKGEAISDFGRHIATKALLTPVQVPPSATGLSSYGHTGTASAVGGTGYAASKPLVGLPSASAPSSGYGSPPKAVYGPPPSAPSSSYGGPPAKLPPSSYGPPPAPAAPSSSYGAPSAPPSSPPASSYGAPPPPIPSTSYGTPVGSKPGRPGDYSGPPPPSSGLGVSGPSNLYIPPSFPSGPAGFSAPATGYGSPLKRDIKLPEGVQAGLLVLKPINVPASSFGALDPRNNRPRVRKSPLRQLASPLTPIL